jgi:hypothetical protein
MKKDNDPIKTIDCSECVWFKSKKETKWIGNMRL